MSAGVEKCPRCDSQLVGRTNGLGRCYLECRGNCGYGEVIERQADPFPSPPPSYYVTKRGTRRKRATKVRSGKRFIGEAA